MSFVSELADFIDTNTTLTIGVDLFDWRLPTEPDDAVLIRHTGGTEDPESPVKEATFQILARSSRDDPVSAETRLFEVYDLIVAPQRRKSGDPTEITTASFEFKSIVPLQIPSTLGTDDDERPIYVFNITAFITAL